jgi:hypothetical protein
VLSKTSYYDKGKPRDTNNPICKEKKESKKEFRMLIRVELAKQRDEENELIMETKTKDMRLFHKLVRNNRKKGNDVIMDLNVTGIQYEEEENVIHNQFIFFVPLFCQFYPDQHPEFLLGFFFLFAYWIICISWFSLVFPNFVF